MAVEYFEEEDGRRLTETLIMACNTGINAGGISLSTTLNLRTFITRESFKSGASSEDDG